ncbi:unnamed protein product [Miscanthus lutarioriparius]|uniref:Uncharacterized protein n=1 Tax=Miscanthus lutarioriparius TaxID=422564 RepID=A0A811QY17_9POAL|nr:unnamed protein product [Miscanthus lutarioriparius]
MARGGGRRRHHIPVVALTLAIGAEVGTQLVEAKEVRPATGHRRPIDADEAARQQADSAARLRTEVAWRHGRIGLAASQWERVATRGSMQWALWICWICCGQTKSIVDVADPRYELSDGRLSAVSFYKFLSGGSKHGLSSSMDMETLSKKIENGTWLYLPETLTIDCDSESLYECAWWHIKWSYSAVWRMDNRAVLAAERLLLAQALKRTPP